MSLVDSDHVTGTRMRRDCHYRNINGKAGMVIWNREVSTRSCEKCNRGAFEYEKVCPRCGGKIVPDGE